MSVSSPEIPEENGLSELDLVADYLPIPLESVRQGGIVGFDIYLRINKKFVLFRKGSLPFTQDVCEKLLHLNAKTLFIKSIQIDYYLEHIEAHLDEVISRQDIPTEEKASSLYSSLSDCIRAFLASPSSRRRLKRVSKLASVLVHFLMEEEGAFPQMIRQMPSDFFSHTHAINVAIYAVSLSMMDRSVVRQSLQDLCFGALLHDVGKTKSAVKERLQDGQDSQEAIRQHPLWGVQLVERIGDIPAVSQVAILSHQERYDGSGYPYGQQGEDIPEVGRIMAVADVFDALTTRMPYRESLTAFEALRLMNSEMRGQFDQEIMAKLIILLGKSRTP